MRKRILLFLIFIGVVVILRYSGIGSYFTLARLKAERAELQQWAQEEYWYAVFLYICTYVGAVTFSIPIAALLTVSGGFLFGTFLGAIYANIGATTGAIFAFLIVRHLLGKAIQKRYSMQLARFNTEMKRYGTTYLFLVHFIAVVPFFLINAFAGLMQVSLWTFVWTTSLGILPASLVYAFAGKQLQAIESMRDIFSFKIIIAFILLALLAIVPMAIRRLRNAHKPIR